jgi:hypothetical protein
MTDEEDHTPERLRDEQAEKARDERRHADDATSEHGAVAHARRAEKAAYLAKRLAERERSEEEK